MKILNFGSLNIDYVYSVNHFVKKGETLSSNNLNSYCGGKGFNQSIALKRAGINIFHAGMVGNDGKFLIEKLKNEHVNVDLIFVDEHYKTGHAIIQKDKEGDNCILLYPGANYSIKKEMVDYVLSNFEKGDFIILQNEINELSYIIKKAHEKGMTIILNPSPVNENILKVDFSKVSYLILNELEFDSIFNKKNRSIKDLICFYPNLKILLTLGNQGSKYYDGNTIIKQNIYKVSVKDTTGAGDTFLGYFISGLIKKMNEKESMDLASKASALSVMKNGAEPSIPFIKEVMSFDFEKLKSK